MNNFVGKVQAIANTCAKALAQKFQSTMSSALESAIDGNNVDTFEEFVDDVQSCGAIMCGLTIDNEPSLNAGMAAIVRKQEYQHIIHNRCTNHSAELLLEDIKEHIPRLASCIDACHEMVTAIRNNKAFKDALKLCQERTGARPKRLIKPANTRKWSTSFLMLSRMQELYAHLTQMEHHFAQTEAPAKRIRLNTWVPWLREALYQLMFCVHAWRCCIGSMWENKFFKRIHRQLFTVRTFLNRYVS
jgi:hypothetical protein